MEQAQGLDGQVALVTGGSRGIGLAAARGLVQAGATVVLVGVDPQRVEAAAKDLRDEGIDAVGYPCDVSSAPAVEDLVASLGSLASVDILVACAGVMSERMAKTLRTSAREWRRVMSVNLDAGRVRPVAWRRTG
jgi:3-oxoacyl-[acyl-carrier protein] reductase